jgi:hypothetical protein
MHRHCCPTYSLSLRERVGERGSDKVNCLFFIPPLPGPLPEGEGMLCFFMVTKIHVLMQFNTIKSLKQ